MWKEKDYVEIPIQASIAPVTLTLQPAPYNSSDNRIQSWTGTYQETEAQNHGRSPQAVIDRVVIGGGALFYPQDITHAHGLVGTVDGGNFTPTGNTAQPYPSGQWHVGPSQAQMYRAQTWSQHYWEKVGPLTLTIYYRCAP